MLPETLRAAWVEIDLNALFYNVQQVKKYAGNTKIIGVVKADGYGCGIVPVARVLLSQGIESLAVTTIQEGINLRKASITCQIIVLGIVPDMYAGSLIEHNFTAIASSYKNAAAFSKAAMEASKTIDIFIGLDTGMGMLGFQATDPESLTEIVEITKLPGLKVSGLFSHLSTAEERDKTYMKSQLARFNSFYESLEKLGVNLPIRTIANSSAMYEHPESHYDAVRPGIFFYGYWFEDVDYFPMKPVMSVKANIVFLKKVPPDFSVGYSRAFITKRESLIATLQIGYGDGYPKLCGGKTDKPRVIVRGCYAPIVGNVCCDWCMVDVTDVPGVQEGDEVVLMGREGDLQIHPGEIGDLVGTQFDVITFAFALRLPRVYVGEPQ